MLIRNRLASIFLLSALMLLAACGGGDPGPGGDGNAALDQGEAETLSALATQSDRFLIAMLQDPFSLTLASSTTSASLPRPLTKLLGQTPETDLGVLQSEECVTEGGNTTDADNDGIPVSATYTIDCDYSDPSYGSLKLTGSFTFSDKDDNDPLSGYTAEVSDYDYTFSADGTNVTFSMDLAIDLTVTADSYTADYTLNYDLSSAEGSGSLSYDYSLTYRPADASDPFAAGTFVVDGSLDFESGGERYSLTVETTPELLYSSSCDSSFVGGSARYEDSEGNALTVSYSGCNNVSASYNGAPL